MRTYVSTMGFHETRVTRPLLGDDLADGDEVVLLRPATEPDPDRGEDAVEYVDDMLHEIAPEVVVGVEQIDHESFDDAVLQCSDVLLAAEGDLVVNFGGGARELFLPLTIATVLHAPLVDKALQYTDIEQDVREWTVPRLGTAVPAEQEATLRAVVEFGPAVSIPELDEHVDKSKSTVSRHVSDLESRDFVETTMHGKTKLVSATLSGQLSLRRRRSPSAE